MLKSGLTIIASLWLHTVISTDAMALEAPVPEECTLPDLSSTEQARCDFIASTPGLCERPGLSQRTRAFCEALREDEDDCRLSERTCAAAGVVLIARHADRLVVWRRTDFRPLSLRWFRPRLLEGLGRDQTVTLLLGPEDLEGFRVERLAQLVYERGGAVVVTDATLADADRLRQLLGVSGAAWREDEGTARLYGLRSVIDDDGRRHSLSFVLFSDPERGDLQFHLPLDPRETAWLLARLGPNPPVLDDSATVLASTENNLYTLAKATVTSSKKSRGGQSIELDTTVIAARVLDPTNWSDFYAVKQAAVGMPCGGQTTMSYGVASALNPDNDEIVVVQQEPGNVADGASYQTGVDFPFAGAVGYPTAATGFDVAPSDAEISFSTTTDLPAGASIALQSAPLDWQLTATAPPSSGITLSASWLWIASSAAYAPDEGQLTFDTASTMDGSNCSALPLTGTLTTQLDRPFPTPSAETPVVQSVLPGNVAVGVPFVISGTGFYPSIITAVNVGGTPLSAEDWVANSNLEITVTAPPLTDASLYGVPLAVEVETTSGSSNSDQNIVINQ